MSSNFDSKLIYLLNFKPKVKNINDGTNKLNNVKNNDFILLVTHQVVISEITKISPPSGGIVIYNTINKKAKLIRNITN